VVREQFTHVAFGDLFLEDVRRYRERNLTGTGLTPLFPLWQTPTPQLAREMIDGGLRARLSCVDTRVLDASFAGREFDASLLADLPASVDPCGENGEFHTVVTDCPAFSAPLALEAGERVLRRGYWAVDVRLQRGGSPV
jgi:diphthamide synthase (EF-2-diphthine--ammonia ligase)